jgi:hypothetical protein
LNCIIPGEYLSIQKHPLSFEFSRLPGSSDMQIKKTFFVFYGGAKITIESELQGVWLTV